MITPSRTDLHRRGPVADVMQTLAPHLADEAQRLHREDRLSGLISSIRMQTLLAPEASLRAPWCIEFPSGPRAFHLVTSGSARLEGDGLEPVELHAGDLAFAAHGAAHRLGSGSAIAATRFDRLVTPGHLPGRMPIAHGGTGPETRLVHGCFVGLDRSAERLLASLPSLLVARDAGDGWCDALLHLVRLEVSAEAPAVHAILHLLGQLLLCRVLRRHQAVAQPREGSLLAIAGRRDIGTAVAAMHADLEHDWTVAGLAQIAGMSRSTFAAMFSTVIGVPPVRYLLERRMERAAELLRTYTPIKEIAGLCGYSTEAAFTHAFRRWAGLPPGAFRARALAAVPVTPGEPG